MKDFILLSIAFTILCLIGFTQGAGAVFGTMVGTFITLVFIKYIEGKK